MSTGWKVADDAIRERARKLWQREGEIEVDDNARVALRTDGTGGAYVQAWVFVPDEQPPRDAAKMAAEMLEEAISIMVLGLRDRARDCFMTGDRDVAEALDAKIDAFITRHAVVPK